jgi:hypothetical protein
MQYRKYRCRTDITVKRGPEEGFSRTARIEMRKTMAAGSLSLPGWWIRSKKPAAAQRKQKAVSARVSV